jgi:hypothetical protein
MSGSETGNVLIRDGSDEDPRKYGFLKADRAQRVRYPCEVGNTFKNITEQVYAAAGGTIPSAQFMTGRVYLDTTASGTITLPTATLIVQLLNNYYRQVLALQGPFTNSNSVVNRIVNEIEVEFYNASAAGITLAVGGTNITFVGAATSLVIPASTIARYKFVIVATNPAAINMFPVGAPGGGAIVTLPIQAPTQLVDYNPATGQLGYITNAVLTGQSATTQIMGWNQSTSTVSQITINQGAPQQLFTRNFGSGAMLFSAVGDYPLGTSTTIPIGINATTGVVERADQSTGATFFQSQVAGETVPNGGATTIVLYDTNTAAGSGVTYNAGVFTLAQPGVYMICVDYAFAAATANVGSYVSLRYGAPNGSAPTTASSEWYRSGEIIKNGSFSIPINASTQFSTFAITITNAEAGVITLSTGASGLGIRNSVKVAKVQ